MGEGCWGLGGGIVWVGLVEGLGEVRLLVEGMCDPERMEVMGRVPDRPIGTINRCLNCKSYFIIHHLITWCQDN